LVVHSRPSPAERQRWILGARFETPGGEVMSDLSFTVADDR
jgi:hypothetical protein